MGRKRTRTERQRDRIGEEIDLEKCPECTAYPDCFALVEGRCTALKSADEGCVFYCPEEKAVREARMAYRALRKAGRTDLIRKYIKLLTALGFLDEEIQVFEKKTRELEAFRDADFEILMKQVPGFSE